MTVKVQRFADYARERLVQVHAELRELEVERDALDRDVLNWGRLLAYLRRRRELNVELTRLERAVTP